MRQRWLLVLGMLVGAGIGLAALVWSAKGGAGDPGPDVDVWSEVGPDGQVSHRMVMSPPPQRTWWDRVRDWLRQ